MGGTRREPIGPHRPLSAKVAGGRQRVWANPETRFFQAVAQDDVEVQHEVQVDEQDEEDEDEQVEPNAMSAKST